jgi:hypothetical protein
MQFSQRNATLHDNPATMIAGLCDSRSTRCTAVSTAVLAVVAECDCIAHLPLSGVAFTRRSIVLAAITDVPELRGLTWVILALSGLAWPW